MQIWSPFSSGFGPQLYRRKWVVALATLALLTAGVVVGARTPPLEEKDSDLKTREYMITIGRQLGVTCTYCHNADNLKDSKLRTFKIAKNHIALVKEVNADPKKRLGVKMDCFMCHQGKAKPDFKEPKAI